MTGEAAYLFGHVLLRAAAYELQPPLERASLHATAADILAAAPQADAGALEIADHLRAARELGGSADAAAERQFTRRAAEFANSRFQSEVAIACWVRLAGLCEGAERARALRTAGGLEARRGRDAAATDLLSRALALADEQGNKALAAATLGAIAGLHLKMGRMDEAERVFLQAQDAERQAGDDVLLVHILIDSTPLMLRHERYEEAERSLRRAIQLAPDDERARLAATEFLARIAMYNGRADAAESLHRQVHTRYRDNGWRFDEIRALTNLGNFLKEQGRNLEAESAYLDAARMSAEIGSTISAATALGNYGSMLLALRRLDEAESVLDRAMRLNSEVDHVLSAASVRCTRSLVFLARGMRQRACAEWQIGATWLRAAQALTLLAAHEQDMRRACKEWNVPPLDE